MASVHSESHENKQNFRWQGKPHARTSSDLFLENLPPELKLLPQWVVYKLGPIKKDGKRDKVPYNPRTGHKAAVNKPQTWATLDEAVEAYLRGDFDGLGFVFTKGDPFVGIDLDGCRDPLTGSIASWALDIIQRVDSYTEASPSGKGIHIIPKGKLPGGGGREDPVEMYEAKRFFTMTGEHIAGTPTTCEERQEAITDLYREYFPHKMNGNGARNNGKRSHENKSKAKRLKILADLKETLPFIPAVEHDTWLKVGMGVHSVDSGEAGFNLWVEWSKTCPEKFDLTDCEKRWRSFHDDGGITEATIFALAIEHGWRPASPLEEGALGEEEEDGQIPKVKITTHIDRMVDLAERFLMALPGPVLYQRARMICRISPAGASPKWIQRPADTPIIVRADTVCLREYSGKTAQWIRLDKREGGWVKALPPPVVFETLVARVAWKFPHLEAVISAPTIRPDGELVSAPGYDQETGLYLDFNGIVFPPVPEAPTRADARAALDILQEPFADFPFKDKCHRSAAIAAVLSLIARFAIPGSVPAFAARSHAKGSGKGLLVNTIATIGTGRTAPTWTQTLDEAEEGKRLLSIAMAGDACMHIDNITKPFGSAKLDSALTSQTVKDRLLGGNTNVEAPWLTMILASGNNMTFVGDMVRRVIPIDLDPKSEHPEERSDFRHTPLLEWVRAERPRLVVAGLTILKAFFHAGCPKQPDIPEFGSFERWADLIRHSLIWAGFPDPCEGRKNLEEESDTSYEQLATLLQCWAVCYPDTLARTLKVVTQDIERQQTPEPTAITPPNEWNDLHDALAAYDTKFDGRKLDTKRIGNALRTIEGRVLEVSGSLEQANIEKWLYGSARFSSEKPSSSLAKFVGSVGSVGVFSNP